MNQFVERFGERIKGFLDTDSEEEQQSLLADILQFANSNPQSFRQDLEKVQFDIELRPLPVVLEALSKDTANWGQFYVDTLDKIFAQAKQSNKPNDILSYLMEFTYIENDNRPFVQKVVDRLCREIDSDNLSTKLAAIWILPAYLTNSSVSNRSSILEALQQKLNDKNWKVRYLTFKSLGLDNMLPMGHKLSMGDKFRKLVFGAPAVF